MSHNFIEIRDNPVVIGFNNILGKKPILAPTSTEKQREDLFPLIIHQYVTIGDNCIIFANSLIGKGTYIGDCVYIRDDVCIGKNCLIGKGVTIEKNVAIGDNVKIMTDAYITSDVVIGDNVFIGPKVVTTNDNTIGRSRHFDKYIKGGSFINDNARIGAGAIILPGIVIGEGACVAAGTIVTKDVIPMTSIKGNPGREFDYEFQRILE